ncbi:MAG: DMT family transporter [Deltaproteobacteria bacterium]|nr:DMT family transporter [Deltaproteobacteria bacterium]
MSRASNDSPLSAPVQAPASRRGLGLAVASPFFFAATNNGIRIVSSNVTIFGLLFLRGLVGVALVVAISRLAKISLTFEKPGLLALIALTGAFASSATTTSITMIPLYQAVVILYLYPAMSVVMARVILGERVSVKGLAGVLTAFVGCVILVLPDRGAGIGFSWGHAIALLGSALYALSFVLTRRLGQGHCGLEPFLFYCVACALVSWPLATIFGKGFGIDSAGEVGIGLIVASLAAIGQVMVFAALKFLPAYKVGVFGTLEIFCGALSSWLIFSDPLTPTGALGAAIIVYAAFGFRERPKTLAAPA